MSDQLNVAEVDAVEVADAEDPSSKWIGDRRKGVERDQRPESSSREGESRRAARFRMAGGGFSSILHRMFHGGSSEAGRYYRDRRR
jgi:hypothetical protein